MPKGKFKAKMFGVLSSGHPSMATGSCQKITEMGFGHSSSNVFVFSLRQKKKYIENLILPSAWCALVATFPEIPWPVSLSEHLVRDVIDSAVGANVLPGGKRWNCWLQHRDGSCMESVPAISVTEHKWGGKAAQKRAVFTSAETSQGLCALTCMSWTS